MTHEAIYLPVPTRERLERMLEQRGQLDALIEATLLATREALGVPMEYELRNLRDGFVAPAQNNVEG